MRRRGWRKTRRIQHSRIGGSASDWVDWSSNETVSRPSRMQIQSTQSDADPPIRECWMRIRLGRLEFERDRLDRAAQCYRRALETLESEHGTGKEIVSALQTLVQLSRSCLRFSEI